MSFLLDFPFLLPSFFLVSCRRIAFHERALVESPGWFPNLLPAAVTCRNVHSGQSCFDTLCFSTLFPHGAALVVPYGPGSGGTAAGA